MEGKGNHGGNRKSSCIVELEELGITKTQSQRGMVGARLQLAMKPAAKERQRAGGRTAGNGRPKQLVANLRQANSEPERTCDQAAALLNVGSRTVNHCDPRMRPVSQVSTVSPTRRRNSGGILCDRFCNKANELGSWMID